MPQKPTGRAPATDVRTSQGSSQVSRATFTARFRQRFHDPAFDAAGPEVARLTDIAWDG